MGAHYTKHEVFASGWTGWVSAARLHKIACCDCGLIQDFRFRVRDGVIMFKARRNVRSTAQRRRTPQEFKRRRR
jgi:hypothetical protein